MKKVLTTLVVCLALMSSVCSAREMRSQTEPRCRLNSVTECNMSGACVTLWELQCKTKGVDITIPEKESHADQEGISI